MMILVWSMLILAALSSILIISASIVESVREKRFLRLKKRILDDDLGAGDEKI